MTHATRFVAVAVLAALALCAPVQAQTPEIDALRARAEQGDAEAQYNLGSMYDEGRGVTQDRAEAARWWLLAAEQGHSNAAVAMGFSYVVGLGVPMDRSEAVRFYRLGALDRHPGGMHMLGESYSTGSGVPQDYVQAHMWFNLAAANFFEEELRDRSISWRERMVSRMTPDQIAEAQRLAREWDAAHPQ